MDRGHRRRFRPEENGIWLGRRAAQFLEAGIGDNLDIGREKFSVAGIFETENGFEDGGVFLPLAAAKEYFHRDGISSVIAVQLRDTAQGAEFKRAVEAAYPGLIALENREFN